MSGVKVIDSDIWKHTRVDGNCIIWIAHRNQGGYGRITRGRRRWLVTRWLWERCIGPLGDKILLHSCDNRACVKLQHLSPGTNQQNTDDAIARGRHNPLLGEALTSDEIADIKRRCAAGEPQRETARLFGISQVLVHQLYRDKKTAARRVGGQRRGPKKVKTP